MKIWIHLNGAQEGPYSLDELPLERMDADTPVWYEGLANWKKAGEAPVTAPLFPKVAKEEIVVDEKSGDIEEKVTIEVSQEDKKDDEKKDDQSANALYGSDLRRIESSEKAQDGANAADSQRPSSPYQWGGRANYSYDSGSGGDKPKCPPTYFAWSIIMTLICCNPVGIAPLITGFCTRQRWNNQNYEGARRMSRATEWLVMITIVTCLMLWPFSSLVQALFQ